MSPEDALAGALGIGAGPASFGDVWAAYSPIPIEARPGRGVTAAIAKAASVSQREVQRWRQTFLGGPGQKRKLPPFRLGRLTGAARKRVIKRKIGELQPAVPFSFRGTYRVSASVRGNPIDKELDSEALDTLRDTDPEQIVDQFYSELFDAYGNLGNLVTVDDVESLTLG